MTNTKALNNKWTILCILISTLTVLYFVFHFVLYEDIVNHWKRQYNLKKDGVCILKNFISKDEIMHLKKDCEENKYKDAKDYIINNAKINTRIRSCTGKRYEFQDYIFIIKKSAIHTCHRDANGDFFNEGQKYPSYTLLIFLEDMDKCLGVVPKSHTNVNSFGINVSDPVVNLICNKGDAILFNANLIHVGALNQKDNNLRIQMKITHEDDVDAIPYYNNYNKILNEENQLPFFVRKAQRKLSCLVPILSNLSQKEIQRTSSKGEKTSMFQQWFSYFFYGNSKFYDLPNAF
jgi:hypothetical protein